MAKDTDVKLVIDVTAVELGNKCNPEVQNAKVSIHYWGGDNVNIVTSGLPKDKPCQILIDIEKLRQVNDFFLNIVYNDLKFDNLQKQLNQLEIKCVKYKVDEDRIKDLEQKNILLETELQIYRKK